MKDNNNLPHGKFHRFLFPFSSRFSDLNFASYVLYIYLCCHVSHTVSLGYLWAHVCSLLCYYSTAYRHIALEKGKMVFENKMQTVAFLDHVYLVHPSTDISVDIPVMIPADTRPMYWSAYWPSVCRSTYWSSVG